MKKWLLGLVLVATAAGCKSNPYCLNCKDSGNGVITPEDMTPSPVDGGDDGMVTGPDMTGQGGPCVPTNGGAEICDGLDNDCNGKIDDVPESRLIGDPKNCGACGKECKFTHAFGQCVGGFDGGMPTCVENGCQPGYVDLDGDPSNGCEYVCTPTNPPTEVCDGKDNNCDGVVDEGFTNNWFDAAKQMPKYDSLLADCGQCGTVCNLGPGTVMACQNTGTNGRGQCAVVACFNGLDANGVHQTYRHQNGNINIVGCEYHCPKPATQLGPDCNPAGACTFPAEVCNGIDDDCNFAADDNLTDPGLNQPCADGTPGKLCSGTQCDCNGHPGPNCACAPGTLKCIGGGLTCQLSTGPSPETCNVKDDDCDGRVDNGFTQTWQDASNQIPAYDSDPSHCGSCTAAACALPHGANICRVAGGDTVGSCAIAACDPGWNFVTKSDTLPITYPPGPKCDVVLTGNRDSTHTTTGKGCFYQCNGTTNFPETCNGVDDDCDGCVDNGLTAPPICSTKGECAKTTNTVACTGTTGNPMSVGWKCQYGSGIDVDGSGNLLAQELECDAEDNNCNGACDENFPDVPISSTAPDNTSCNNPRSAKSCSGGQGACQLSGAFACNAGKSAEQCQTAGGTAIGANGDQTKASDEKCNGKDDDCDGQVDEASDSMIAGTTYKGWHDPVAQLSVAADPFTGQAAHTVYVYAYEATKPDATATSPGSLSTRACANYGVLPWANVTLAQAQAACAGIKNAANVSIGRLCSAWEVQQACNGNTASGTHWSMSVNPTTYVAKVCNDTAETEQRCNPTAANCTKTCNANNQCTCSSSADCGGGTCTAGVCVGSVCPSQCASGQTCNANGQCSCATDSDCAPGFACNASKICVGSGAWPTGSVGTFSGGDQCYVDYGANGRVHDLTGNLQEWTSTPVTLKSGTGASMTATSGGQSTVSGLSQIFSSDVGAQLVITSATDAGTYDIVAASPPSSVTVKSTTAVAASGLSWKIVYDKVRGGAFTTTVSTGDSCEFDFDIQKASFANSDVGFRCCSDVQP